MLILTDVVVELDWVNTPSNRSSYIQIIISCVFINGSFKSSLVFVSSDYRINDVLDFLVNEESLSPTLPNHKKEKGTYVVEKKYNFGISKSK